MTKKIKFSLPENMWERLGLIITSIFGVMMWILANKLMVFGITYDVSFLVGITMRAIDLFWIALVLFHIGLMFLITRSVIIGGTKNYIDGVAGFVATVGIFSLISSTIAGIYFGNNPVIWLFGIKQFTLFSVGFMLEAVALIFFAITE